MKNQDIDKLLKTLKTPEPDFSGAKEHSRSKIMSQFKVHKSSKKQNFVSRFKSWMGSGWLPKLELSGVLAGMAAVLIIFSTLATAPLTAKDVLAKTAESYSQQAQQGRYHYSKDKTVNTMMGAKGVTLYQESWMDTKSSDSRFTESSEDGRLINDTITKDGKTYSYYNDAIMQEIYSGPESEIKIEYIIPGADKANLTMEDLEKLSQAEFDKRLTDAGQKAFYAPMYKTTDFPGYTMSGEETKNFTGDEWMEAFPEDIYVEVQGGDSEEGMGDPIGDYNWEEDPLYYVDEIKSSAKADERINLVNKLKELDTVSLIDGCKSWEGYDVFCLSQEDTLNPGNFTNIYIDRNNFRMVGLEFRFEFPEGSQFGGGSFKTIALEDSFSDQAPDFEQKQGVEYFAQDLYAGEKIEISGINETFSEKEVGLEFVFPVEWGQISDSADYSPKGTGWSFDFSANVIRAATGDLTQEDDYKGVGKAVGYYEKDGLFYDKLFNKSMSYPGAGAVYEATNANGVKYLVIEDTEEIYPNINSIRRSIVINTNGSKYSGVEIDYTGAVDTKDLDVVLNSLKYTN